MNMNFNFYDGGPHHIESNSLICSLLKVLTFQLQIRKFYKIWITKDLQKSLELQK